MHTALIYTTEIHAQLERCLTSFLNGSPLKLFMARCSRRICLRLLSPSGRAPDMLLYATLNTRSWVRRVMAEGMVPAGLPDRVTVSAPPQQIVVLLKSATRAQEVSCRGHCAGDIVQGPGPQGVTKVVGLPTMTSFPQPFFPQTHSAQIPAPRRPACRSRTHLSVDCAAHPALQATRQT